MAIPLLVPAISPDGKQIETPIQQTTLGLDVLSRFICNTLDEVLQSVYEPDLLKSSGFFDAIIIGAGMYGGYCAEQIWKRGGKVLVLEAGPFLVSEHVQNLANIGLNTPAPIFQSDPAVNTTRAQVWGIPWRGNQSFPGLAYCVGGKSLYWGGWSPRLTDDVLEEFPEGARNYLKQHYESIELQIGVAKKVNGVTEYGTGFIDDTGPGGLTRVLRDKLEQVYNTVPGLEQPQRAPVAVQGDNPSSGLFSFDKFSSAPILTDAIRQDVNISGQSDVLRRISLVPKCHVTHLNTSLGTVTSIEVWENNQFRNIPIPSTCKVLLAMSCIESTRLALESFPTNLMGRNLMVHVRSNFAVRIPRKKFPGLNTGPVQTAAIHVPGLSSKKGRFHFQIVAGANRNNAAEEIWFRTIPDIDTLQGILNNQDSDYVALQFRLIGEMFGVKNTGTPDPDSSWIDLSPETDEFNRRRAFVHLKLLGIDEELWNEMDDAAFQLAEALGDGDTEYWLVDDRGNAFYSKNRPSRGLLNYEGNPRGIRDALGTTYHESGTMWMGNNPQSSVTDATGKFHHINNAFCIDQSLFTRGGSANPVPTGLTLARQVADIVMGYKEDNDNEFVPLFKFNKPDDRLPDGWEHFGGGSFARWRNIMETEGGIGLLVYTKKAFRDCIVRLEWRSFSLFNNSGVYVRLPNDGNGTMRFDIKKGYEIQIDNTGNRPGDASSFPEENFNVYHQTGAIYPVHDPGNNNLPVPNGQPSKRNIPTRPLGQWNDYEIQVINNRLKVLLNGQEVLEQGTYMDNANRYPQGHLALQNHFKGARVQFRNMRVKEL